MYHLDARSTMYKKKLPAYKKEKIHQSVLFGEGQIKNPSQHAQSNKPPTPTPTMANAIKDFQSSILSS